MPSTNPSQALNLGGLPYAYSDTFSILNLFHGADAWFTFDTNGKEIRGTVRTDGKGWPTEFPTFNGEAQSIVANVFYTDILPAGDYIVEWKGSSDVLPYQNYEKLGPNKYLIHYKASYANGTDGISLHIGPSSPTDKAINVSDIKFYKADYADLIGMGENFNPKWFQAIDDFRVLRTHDWQLTNFSKVTGPTANDFTADQAAWVTDGRGMPYETLVQVANQARSDLWINIPHMATDDYMRQVASYVKDHLDKGLRVYVEYSNEYWTTIFDQHDYLVKKGQEMFPGAEFSTGEAYAARFSQMTAIFKDVFGAENARLYPTLTLDHNMFSTEEAMSVLTAPDWVRQGGKSPLEAGVRYLATDGYFSWFNGDPAFAAQVEQWMKNPDKGYGAARDYLVNRVDTNLVPNWQIGRQLADKYGLEFGIYEGGALLINEKNGGPGDPKQTEFNNRVELTAQMKQVYQHAIQEWQKVGNGTFAWYADTGRAGTYQGDYGLWNAPNFKPEPRAEAIISANTKTAPWLASDPRPASTFDNGLYDAGTGGKDTMNGTALADRLYGLAGDDVLYGRDGNDILVGGLGKDKLYGGAGDDRLVGGQGADMLDGGGGFDFASYQLSTQSVSVDLNNGKGLAGDALGDTYKSIEGLIGGMAADTLIGNSQNNRIDGGDGNDTLNGGRGNDSLKGGAGNDILFGGSGNDIFYLGTGNDVVKDWQEGDHIVIDTGKDSWAFGDPSKVVISQSGADTLVSYNNGVETWTLRLENTQSSTITIADDFLFG